MENLPIKTNEMKIYQMIYDNPINKDGTEKPNKLLGDFKIKQRIFKDSYSEEFIGIRKEDGKWYLVKGFEVSYYNSGTRYETTKIKCFNPLT